MAGFLGVSSVCQTRTNFSPLKIRCFWKMSQNHVPVTLCRKMGMSHCPEHCQLWPLLVPLSRTWLNYSNARTKPGKILSRQSLPAQARLRDYEKFTARGLPCYLGLAEATGLSGMFRRNASLAIPHLRSFAAIPWGQKRYHKETVWQRFCRTFGWTFWCDLPQNPCFTW